MDRRGKLRTKILSISREVADDESIEEAQAELRELAEQLEEP